MSKREIVGKEDLDRVAPSRPNKKMRLVVGIPISVNNMYYNNRSRGYTEKTKQYMLQTRAKVMGFVEDNQYKLEKSGVWQYLDIIVYMPDKRIRDSHNMIKLLMDSLQGVAFRDDYNILPRIQSVELDRDNPRLDMVLSNQTKAQRVKEIKNVSNVKLYS